MAAEALEIEQTAPLPPPGTAPPATNRCQPACPPHLACIPLQGTRMWVTPDRYESCLGEVVTQRRRAPRLSSCQLTDGLALGMEPCMLGVGCASLGAVEQQTESLTLGLEHSLKKKRIPAKWPQSGCQFRITYQLSGPQASALHLSNGGVSKCSDF